MARIRTTTCQKSIRRYSGSFKLFGAMKIFLTAFLQVGLVAVNTYLITNLIWIGIFVCSFFISFLWAFNVSKVALSKTKDKIIYAFGAGCGAITGLLILQAIL